jgi:hypothetical protein
VSFDKDRYKIEALLREYSEIRSEVRTFEILQVICIFLSVLSFVAMFSIGIIHDHYIIVFISPSISIFFILIALAILGYNTSLGVRSVRIEGILKKILGESTIEWEQTVGIFGFMGGGVLSIKITRYWTKISALAIITGVIPVFIGLAYGFNNFFNEVDNVAWYLIIFYLIIAGLMIFMGYRFYTRDWEKVSYLFELENK